MRLLATASLLVLTLAGCARTAQEAGPVAAPAPAAATAAAAPRPIPTQLPTDVRPISYGILIQPDAANLRFKGSVLTHIEVLEPTDEIVMNAADLDFQSAELVTGVNDTVPASGISVDEARQQVRIRFAQPVPKGRHRLAIEYDGRIYTQAAGLFALDYDGPQGRKRALFTQFEAPDARRMFPGWDEPQFRTHYALTVTVPEGQDAVSNMTQASSEKLADGRRMISFQTRPRRCRATCCSSRSASSTGSRRSRPEPRSESSPSAATARRAAGRWKAPRRSFPGTTTISERPIPLPKLDNVAGPGSSQFFGAMENWGAIFSFESILLVDPAITTEARRQSIFEVAAHEIAHQWFGDLVTMAWWDDLWLNEGFASWMATKATAALHPEWEPELGNVDGPRIGDQPRFGGQHPPGHSAHQHGRADQPGLRRDHLPQGRGGDRHARGLCRRGCLAARSPGLYPHPPARRTRRPTTSGRRSRRRQASRSPPSPTISRSSPECR